MKDDRLRVPVDTAYVEAIGMATFCFARLEWAAVYCGQKLSPGYVNAVATKTAGTIANEVAGFAQSIPDQHNRARYQAATAEFRRLVDRRNDLMHANPATIGAEQWLVRPGVPWQPAEIDNVADEFAACSIELTELYYHVL